MKNSDNILVSICCLSYNHEAYIRECLIGFMMQKTSFQIEILIHDDASTDKTANIIKEYAAAYPEIIKPIYQKENQYSRRKSVSATYQFPRALGKYIAFCEGDDYWTDPYKLQKQVDFLEKNTDYAMISGGIELINDRGERLDSNEMLFEQKQRNISDPTLFNLLNCNLINTLTVCVKAEIVQKLVKETSKNKLWYVIDYWLWLNIAINHKIFISNDIYAAYRIHEKSLSRSTGFLRQRMSRIRFDTIKNFVRQKKIISNAEKVMITNVILGLINTKKRERKIRAGAFLWLLLHPAYFYLWLKERY